MKVKVKEDFSEIDAILFDAALIVHHRETKNKTQEYIRWKNMIEENDPDTLQLLDERDTEWVDFWRNQMGETKQTEEK